MTGLKCQEGAVDTVFVQKGAIRTPSIASLEVTDPWLMCTNMILG